MRDVRARHECPVDDRGVDLQALEIKGQPLGVPKNRYRDLRALRPPHPLRDPRRVEVPDVLAVDLDDHVPGLYPGALGRGALDRGADDDLALALLDLYPDPDVPPGELLLACVLLLGGQKARVPLIAQGVEHAFDRRVGLPVRVDRVLVHIVLADNVERLGVDPQALLIPAVERGRTLRVAEPVPARPDRPEHEDGDESGKDASETSRAAAPATTRPARERRIRLVQGLPHPVILLSPRPLKTGEIPFRSLLRDYL